MTMVNDVIVSQKYQKEHGRTSQKGFILIEYAVALMLCSLTFLAGAIGIGAVLQMYTHAVLYHKAHVYAACHIQSLIGNVKRENISIDTRFKVAVDEEPAKLIGTNVLFKVKRCRVVVQWHDGIQEQKLIYQGFKTSEIVQT